MENPREEIDPKSPDAPEENHDVDRVVGPGGERLFSDLLDDIDVMYRYARTRGLTLPDTLIVEVSSLLGHPDIEVKQR